MKKLILAVAAFSFLAIATVSAQGASFGAKIGMNVASIFTDDGEDYSSRGGFVIGAMSEFKFSTKSALSIDLMYSGQGNKKVEEFSEETTKQSLGYLNIPILYNYYVIEGLAVKAGIQPGVLLSANKTVEDGDATDIKDDFTALDISLPIGVSYEVYPNVIVDLRYNIGLTNVNENPDGYSQKHGVFQMTVGYKL